MTYLGKHLNSYVQSTILKCKHHLLEGQVMAASYLILVSFLTRLFFSFFFVY